MSQRALDAAVDAARAAGRIALKYFRGGFEVAKKPDDTPVTPADREAEQAIVEILGRAFPDCGVLGEEFGGRGTKEVRWIIDPIDGTKNFVRGIGIWATLIALEERGEVTVGVIHNPVTAELYTARRGAGAFLNGERIRVSDVAELGRAFFLHAGLGIVRKGGHWDGFARLIDATDRQRGFGDYMGYGLVAEGAGGSLISQAGRRSTRAPRSRRTGACTTPPWLSFPPDARHPSRRAGRRPARGPGSPVPEAPVPS